MLNLLLLIVGLGLILGGANYLTDGAAAIARRFGLSDLIVGLTVVAFGTSAPELTISVMSAVQGSPGMAIGNVAGSNIFNVLMIIGVVALVRPIRIEKGISRVDGILLLLFLCIFMRYIFAQAKAKPENPTDVNEGSSSRQPGIWLSVVMVLGGLAALIYGGDLFVSNASEIARSLGVSDAVIGLTIVAAGTSLPELATSLTAALKGNTGIAVGNVLGCHDRERVVVLAIRMVYPDAHHNPRRGRRHDDVLSGVCGMADISGCVISRAQPDRS